jgi:hypothetical protein
MRGTRWSRSDLSLIKLSLGSTLCFVFSVVCGGAISLALFSQAQPSTGYFDHRDSGVGVRHNTCQFKASLRIEAIMVRIHCFDPNSPTKLDHNAIGE